MINTKSKSLYLREKLMDADPNNSNLHYFYIFSSYIAPFMIYTQILRYLSKFRED